MWQPEYAERRREYDREYHARLSPERRTHKLVMQAARRAKIRAAIEQYKIGQSCSCGESHPACLDFHHNAGDKEINVADAIQCGWGIERLMREIKKCIVVCANCHRKLHARS